MNVKQFFEDQRNRWTQEQDPLKRQKILETIQNSYINDKQKDIHKVEAPVVDFNPKSYAHYKGMVDQYFEYQFLCFDTINKSKNIYVRDHLANLKNQAGNSGAGNSGGPFASISLSQGYSEPRLQRLILVNPVPPLSTQKNSNISPFYWAALAVSAIITVSIIALFSTNKNKEEDLL